MITSNIQWGNFNASRSYPLVDAASKIDDVGCVLPDDILVDCNIWIEGATYYGGIFVSSVAISPSMTSITFAASNGGVFTPIARLTVTGSVTPYRNYAIIPLVDFAAGWVTFGPGVKNVDGLKTWRFSSTAQTGLLPGNATQFVRTDVVKSIGKKNRQIAFTGDVGISSATPDQLVIEYIPATDQDAREINGVPVNAIVFRLNLESSGADLLKKYLGPCDSVPESGTCNRPPIFSVSGAIPNCNGVIDLFFTEDVVPQLGRVFVIQDDTDEYAININATIPQIDVCDYETRQFIDLCSATCVTQPQLGPFASYNRIYGGSL